MSKQKLMTMDPVEVGRPYFGIGRDASRRAAKTGEMPCIKIGERYFASELEGST